MEEVDNIIFHSLRMIGCDIDEEVKHLAELSADMVVEATVRCVELINGQSLELPKSLPPSMSARFRLGTNLASHVSELGYKGEIGYQTFLYSNEIDIRRVFMFLIDKLPKEAAEKAEENLGSSILLQRRISSEFGYRLNLAWTPSYCKYEGARWNQIRGQWHKEGCSGDNLFCSCPLIMPQGLGDISNPVPKDVKNYYSKHMLPISEQTYNKEDVISAVLNQNAEEYTEELEWEAEWNALGLASRMKKEDYIAQKREKIRAKMTESLNQAIQESSTSDEKSDLDSLLSSLTEASSGHKMKGSRFTHAEKLQFAPSDEKAAEQLGLGPGTESEKELEEKRQAELEELVSELNDLSSKTDKFSTDIKKFTAGNQQLHDRLETLKKENEEGESACRIKKRTLDLLPDAENNLSQLQTLIDSSAQRLVTLANQWEKHRLPLVEEYRQLKVANEQKMSESQKKLAEIKSMRQRMKELAENVREKEELHKQLLVEYEQMTKDVNRSVYTQRIMEIVTNIKRQKDEIDKVLIDTRALQKEINQLNGKLDRTFTVTDELIFKDAKKDDAVRKTYKYLAELHESCDALIRTVSETGELTREIRELEDQIDNESNSRTVANLEKITADYQQLKAENVALAAKLKKS